MARSRRKTKRAASHRNTAGTRRRRVRANPHRRRGTRRNPSMGAVGSPKTWLMGGAGALAGFIGSAAIPQMFLGAGNVGISGYAATAAATLGLGFLAHMLMPRQQAVTIGVVSGGFANLIRRVISDNTPYGQFLSSTPGMGDYMVANWGPPIMQNGLQSAMATAPGAPWGQGGYGGMVTSSGGVSSQDLADMRSSRPC